MTQSGYYRNLLRTSAERRSPRRAMRGEIRRMVARLLRIIRFEQPPTDLQAVARQLSVRSIRLAPLSMRGRLVIENGGDIVIEINRSLPELSQRQVLAHEISHLLLEPERLNKSASLGRGVKETRLRQFYELEQRCDEAAIELLVPTDWLLAHQPSNLTEAVRLADSARMELDLLLRRLVDIGIWQEQRLWWVTASSPLRLIKSYPTWDDDLLARVTFDRESEALIYAAQQSMSHKTGQVRADLYEESVNYPAEALKVDGDLVVLRLLTSSAM